MAESEDDTTNCPVCFEDYTDGGDHLPRLLPCSHTICELCVKLLLEENSLRCPECRVKHGAKRGLVRFPQNKYILKDIRRKAGETGRGKSKRPRTEQCKKHHREISLYCKDPECKKPICPVCLTKDHRGHDVVDIHEVQAQKFDVLKQNASQLERNLLFNKETLLLTKQQLEKFTEESLTRIKNKKAEQDKLFDKLIEDITSKAPTIGIDDEVAILDKNLELVRGIKQRSNKTTSSNDDIAKKLDKIKDMIEKVKRTTIKGRTYEYLDYSPSTEPVERQIGKLDTKGMRITLSEPKYMTEEECAVFRPVEMPKPNQPLSEEYRICVSQFSCNVSRYIHSTLTSVLHLSVLDGGGVVVVGEEEDGLKLKLYLDGACITVSMDEPRPDGMAVVTLDGESCIALSYGDEQKITFRSVLKPNQLLHSYLVKQYRPERMCAVSSDTLLFEDCSQGPRKVRWLDCSVTPPRVKGTTPVEQNTLHDICYAEIEGHGIVITTDSKKGVCLYDQASGKLGWEVKGMVKKMEWELGAQAVTTDGDNYVFVCDINNECVHVLNLLDGRVMVSILKDDGGKKGLGQPIFIRWCKDEEALAVAHRKNEEWNLSFICFTRVR